MPPYIFCIIYLWESYVEETSHGHAILLPVSKDRVRINEISISTIDKNVSTERVYSFI